MLDYEIKGYIVYWKKEIYGKIVNRCREFGTEEEAVEFVKGYRLGWVEYRIEQRRTAIIDF
jgi:hypothetical protein